MKINSGRKRKAISPILATVILIAITLIAAIAIAGFVFGLFGSFTSTARVSATSVNLNHVIFGAACTGAPLCTVYFTNIGSSNVNVNSLSLTYGGATCAPTVGAAPVSIPATSTATPVTVTAVGTCVAGVIGQSFTGNAALSNGGQVPFSGTFS